MDTGGGVLDQDLRGPVLVPLGADRPLQFRVLQPLAEDIQKVPLLAAHRPGRADDVVVQLPTLARRVPALNEVALVHRTERVVPLERRRRPSARAAAGTGRCRGLGADLLADALERLPAVPRG